MPANLSLRDLWESMPADRQHEACIDFWESDADPYTAHERSAFLRRLARLNQFHAKFLERQTLNDRVRVLLARVHTGQCDAAAPIRSWLLTRHALMIGQFLDLIRFKHERGVVKDAIASNGRADDASGCPPPGSCGPATPDIAGLYLGYLLVGDTTQYLHVAASGSRRGGC